MTLRNLKTPVYTGRTCQEKYWTPERAGYLGLCNVRDLLKIVQWNEKAGVKLFRISSHMFPHATNPNLLMCPEALPHGKEITQTLNEVGKFCSEHGHFLSLHAPHFVSLASESEEVQKRSIEELVHHEWIIQTIENGATGPLTINLNWHFGRGYDNAHVPVFVSNWRKLPAATRARACIENDDKKNCWSVTRLHRELHELIGCRICFDAFHWEFCQHEGRREAFDMARATWNGDPMECHISSSRTPYDPCPTHAAYLCDDIPEYLLDELLFIEAEQKELALFRYANEHGITLTPSLLRFP